MSEAWHAPAIFGIVRTSRTRYGSADRNRSGGRRCHAGTSEDSRSDSHEAIQGGSRVGGCGNRRHVNRFVHDSHDVRVRLFAIVVDDRGAMYVGVRRDDYDPATNGVLKLDRDWNIVAAIGFGQPGEPVFNAVHDMAVGPDGSLYVAETRTKRVVKLHAARR